MQIAVFKLNNNTLYGIDVNNIVSFIIKDNADLKFMPSKNISIEGIATFNSNPSPIINLDKWLDKENINKELIYKVLLQIKVSDRVLTLLINNVVGLFEIKDEDLKDLNGNIKVKNLCYINIEGKKELCVILNYEYMLKDLELIRD